MSYEGFQLVDNAKNDNSIMKRSVLKFYHHQAANLNDSDQNMELKFGENNNYHGIGNPFPEYESKIRKNAAVAANRVPVKGDDIE